MAHVVRAAYAIMAIEDICQLDSIYRASLQYERYLGLYVFSFSEMATPPVGYDNWESPPLELSFQSQFADEWELKCQKNNETEKWYHCTYFARYKEFLLKFDVNNDSDVYDEFIQFDDLNQILYKIDQRMGEFLYPDD